MAANAQTIPEGFSTFTTARESRRGRTQGQPDQKSARLLNKRRTRDLQAPGWAARDHSSGGDTLMRTCGTFAGDRSRRSARAAPEVRSGTRVAAPGGGGGAYPRARDRRPEGPGSTTGSGGTPGLQNLTRCTEAFRHVWLCHLAGVDTFCCSCTLCHPVNI